MYNRDMKNLKNTKVQNNKLMDKKDLLAKLENGGFDAALQLIHENQRMDVKLDLAIWLNDLEDDKKLSSNNILSLIRRIDIAHKIRQIKKQKNKGVIDKDLNQLVFFKPNDFFMEKSRPSLSLKEEDIMSILKGCLKQFFKQTMKTNQEILFLHLVRDYNHGQIAKVVGLKRDAVKYLILNWKNNGLYDLVRKSIKESY